MDAKFERRFKSFCNSLDALAEARQRDLTDSFVLSGTSAKFSITFDLSWKVMKDILVQYYSQFSSTVEIRCIKRTGAAHVQDQNGGVRAFSQQIAECI